MLVVPVDDSLVIKSETHILDKVTESFDRDSSELQSSWQSNEIMSGLTALNVIANSMNSDQTVESLNDDTNNDSGMSLQSLSLDPGRKPMQRNSELNSYLIFLWRERGHRPRPIKDTFCETWSFIPI